MSTRQTRRSAAAKAAAEEPRLDEKQSQQVAAAAAAAANGNGAVHGAPRSSDEKSPENIFLFWPNIVGYFRIVLAIASLYYMPLHPRTCSLLYSISCLLDALDGHLARIFEQSTRFGAVLDMVTDRCTTSCLLVFLSSAFPRWAIVFQSLIALDFASHYMHMYATLVVGGSDSSHKNIAAGNHWCLRLLRLYYTNKVVLFVSCALNELFFIALYLLSFSSPMLSPHLIKKVEEKSGGGFEPGTPVNTSILQQIFPDPFSAAALELARANKMDSFVPWTIAGICVPIMVFKQFMNVVQLVWASQQLADVDIASRKAKGLPREVKSKRG